MSALRDFIISAAVAMTAGVAVPFFLRAFRPKQELRTGSPESSILSRLLYGLLVAILVFAPAVSFVIASELEVPDASAYVFILSGLIALLSFPMTLLTARSIGREQYLEYWLYLEKISKVDRRAILILWLCSSCFVAGIGALSLILG